MYQNCLNDSIPDFVKNQENYYYTKQTYKYDFSTDVTDLNQPDSHLQLLQPAETQQGDIFESESQEEVQQDYPIQEQSQNSTPSFNFLSQNSLNVNCSSIQDYDGEQYENILPPQQLQQLKQQSSLQSNETQSNQQQQIQQPQPLYQSKEPQLNQYSQTNNNHNNNSQEILASTQNPNQQEQQKQLDEEYSPNNKKPKKPRKQRNLPNINKTKKTLDQAIFMIVLLSYYKDKGNFPDQKFPYTEQEAKNILYSPQFLPKQYEISQLLQNLNKFRQSQLKYIKNRDIRSEELCFREKTILGSLGKNIRIFQYLYNNFQVDKEFIDNNYNKINQYYLYFSRSQNYNNKIKLKVYCENINIALIQVLQWQIKHDQSKKTLNEEIIQCIQYLESQQN